MTKVAIIGGGISGIKAAIDLGQAGVNVIILEARDRLGGRIVNTTKNDITYDLGPSWLHDTEHNELMPFARKAGVRMIYDDHESEAYDLNGLLDQKEVDLTAARFYSALHKEYADESKRDMTLKKYVEKYLQRNNLSDFEKRLVSQIARAKELWHAISWDRISCRYVEYAEPTSSDAFVLDSFTGILNQILKVFKSTPNVTTRLNCEVSRVRTVGAKYLLNTTDGTTIESDYVVVTIPVMVLQNVHRTLFEPNLPSYIVRAIELTDTAQLGKIYTRFESVFWDIEKDSFTIFGNGKDEGPGSHVVDFVNGYNLFQQPVLLAITSPPLTTILETGGLQAIEYLEPYFNAIRLDNTKPLPAVLDMVSTDWSQDKYARGSYSALAVDVHPEDIVDPFVEGHGNLRFAGEHTVKAASGCAHGAYRSGEKEARYILNRERVVARL
jgi:polyamine oxidase